MVDAVTTLNDAVLYLTSKINGGDENEASHHHSLNIGKAVDVIEKAAIEQGLSPADITSLVDVATWHELPKKYANRVIKSLIPTLVVPEGAVVKVVSVLGTDGPTLDIKVMLLRWLLVVFDHIEPSGFQRLRQLYGLLFLLLNNVHMSRHLCHLLYQLTAKHHVRQFRIDMLLRLQKSMVEQEHAPILGLLSIYKHYQPHLISLALSRSRKVFFRSTDIAWRAKVLRVNRRQGPLSAMLPPAPENLIKQTVPNKKQKLDFVPRKVECPVVVKQKPQQSQLVPYSQINSFTELLDSVNRLELPSQIASVLFDENLQLVVACCVDSTTYMRLEYWLQHTLFEEFMNTTSGDSDRQQKLLANILSFTELLQESLPICDEFLASFLLTWNGYAHREHIFRLVARTRIRPYAEVYQLVLDPLRRLFFSSSVYFKCQVIHCWTELLRHWAQVEYHSHKTAASISQQKLESCNFYSLFVEDTRPFSVVETLSSLIEFVDTVSVMALRQHRNNTFLLHFILSFFEEVTMLSAQYQLPMLIAPSPGIIYVSLFHCNAMAVSRICGIIYNCHVSHHLLRQNRVNVKGRQKSIVMVNSYSVDVVDTLWRLFAFSDKQSSSPSSQLNLLNQATLEALAIPDVHTVSSLFHHWALIGYAHKFLSVTQSDAQLSSSVMKKYRDLYVEFLSRNHVIGIQQFMTSCVSRRSSLTGTPTN